MRKLTKVKFIIILFYGLLISLCFSCESKDSLTIGSNFVSSGTNVQCVDTLGVKLSTILSDSIVTSGTDVILAGNSSDGSFGSIKSRSYLTFSNSNNSINQYAEYDSLVLVLTPSGYYFGDTTKQCRIDIRRVSEDIKFPVAGSSDLYNTSKFAVKSNILGQTKLFYPMPKSKNEIRVRLDDSLGRAFLDILREGIDGFEQYGGFTNYFKGLRIEGSDSFSGNDVILGFTTSKTVINLYYHVIDDASAGSSISFDASSHYQFNEVLFNKGDAIKNVKSEAVGSDLLQNMSYIQNGVGLITRIDFPTLKEYLYRFNSYKILKAVLVVQPDISMSNQSIPSSLYLYPTNSFNQVLGDALRYGAGSNALDGSLKVDYLNYENTQYSWDITSYLLAMIASTYDNEYKGLLVYPKNFNSSFDKLLIADQKKSKNRTYLKLYVLYYE